MKIENYIRNNEEIIDNLFYEIKAILYSNKPLSVKMKLLHKAHYWASYTNQLNNVAILQHLKEKV